MNRFASPIWPAGLLGQAAEPSCRIGEELTP
jgi:hypothetical protein